MINPATQTQYEMKGTIMKTVTRYTTAVLLGVLIAAPFASAQEKSKHSSGTVETRRLNEFDSQLIERMADR